VNATILAVFAFVYAAMLLGRLPRLQLDRTGAALLGAIVLLAAGAVTLEQAGDALDVPTLALLFGLMVVSAQLRLGGFYSRVSRALAGLPLAPPALLGVTVLVVGALSAVFSNDIVCLAVAPVLIDGCERRRTDPVPFLLALACAANVGSAATFIGNPQNMLVGQTLGLSFPGHLAVAALPTALGLLATWGIIAFEQHGRWRDAGHGPPAAPREGDPLEPVPAFDAWQTAKGLGVAAALLAAFLFTGWPRELCALAGAGVLLTSRKLHSRRMLGLVDWQLLVLFMGLFVVNGALAATGIPERAVGWLAERGLDPARPPWLFALVVALSNAVSNVPAVMLLLPVAHHELAGPVLALASTLAGNLFIVGSIANIIVVDAAAQRGIAIDWRRHARTGIPVTIATLAIAAACLAWSARGG
jgi:Na+/H+ antiporter NhaD/arsenite permease-like protein